MNNLSQTRILLDLWLICQVKESSCFGISYDCSNVAMESRNGRTVQSKSEHPCFFFSFYSILFLREKNSQFLERRSKTFFRTSSDFWEHPQSFGDVLTFWGSLFWGSKRNIPNFGGDIPKFKGDTKSWGISPKYLGVSPKLFGDIPKMFEPLNILGIFFLGYCRLRDFVRLSWPQRNKSRLDIYHASPPKAPPPACYAILSCRYFCDLLQYMMRASRISCFTQQFPIPVPIYTHTGNMLMVTGKKLLRWWLQEEHLLLRYSKKKSRRGKNFLEANFELFFYFFCCLLYTSPSPRD